MFIAIDGACKRNGQENCSSLGVAWINDRDNLHYEACFETCSTNQRGEINGLITALSYAASKVTTEDIIIVTDSEYLYNTVMLGWSFKWENNNWQGSSGTVKNIDMWSRINVLLKRINKDAERVFMQWTKGHLISYPQSHAKAALKIDSTGVELYNRILTVANRPADRTRIINDVLRELKEHGHMALPSDYALEIAVYNTVADCVASTLINIYDELADIENLKLEGKNHNG